MFCCLSAMQLICTRAVFTVAILIYFKEQI
jgi:hypothetical protein